MPIADFQLSCGGIRVTNNDRAKWILQLAIGNWKSAIKRSRAKQRGTSETTEVFRVRPLVCPSCLAVCFAWPQVALTHHVFQLCLYRRATPLSRRPGIVRFLDIPRICLGFRLVREIDSSRLICSDLYFVKGCDSRKLDELHSSSRTIEENEPREPYTMP